MGLILYLIRIKNMTTAIKGMILKVEKSNNGSYISFDTDIKDGMRYKLCDFL